MESDVVAFQKSTHAARSRDTTHHRQRDPKKLRQYGNLHDAKRRFFRDLADQLAARQMYDGKSEGTGRLNEGDRNAILQAFDQRASETLQFTIAQQLLNAHPEFTAQYLGLSQPEVTFTDNFLDESLITAAPAAGKAPRYESVWRKNYRDRNRLFFNALQTELERYNVAYPFFVERQNCPDQAPGEHYTDYKSRANTVATKNSRAKEKAMREAMLRAVHAEDLDPAIKPAIVAALIQAQVPLVERYLRPSQSEMTFDPDMFLDESTVSPTLVAAQTARAPRQRDPAELREYARRYRDKTHFFKGLLAQLSLNEIALPEQIAPTNRRGALSKAQQELLLQAFKTCTDDIKQSIAQTLLEAHGSLVEQYLGVTVRKSQIRHKAG